MNIDAFDFELPEDRIALRPANPRDSARLLVVRGPEGILEDYTMRDLPGLLRAGDIVVTNNTRVLKAALKGRRASRELDGADVAIDFNLNRQCAPDRWSAFARPAKRLKVGDEVRFGDALTARVSGRSEGGEVELLFNRGGTDLSVAIEACGEMPLPPYITSKRAADERDIEDYQTTFANEVGSVAAPTAGLHFTPELLSSLQSAGVQRETVTLHVNAGTFLPVKAERTEDHIMHPEFAVLEESAASVIRSARSAGGRCIPIGTTALRTLESAAANGDLLPFAADTSIFITPGHQFRAVDGLLTNFHLPRSTLFMLVSAMMGLQQMKRAYAHAVANGYRFFSYGDACLLLPNG
ncbi:MAG: tRNA preQ1(34) S-adenosylmethionine ribosyltransferase-isomerase QueA [Alphaproteobacteria bacterium]|nr:tRNA preQ1(34) S-adenosylmethionine ribosyltransferase-isomerase QueA [Alphaproteobacteria bacterium]